MPDQNPAHAASFDLADAPWLPCLRTDGTGDLLSVRTVLQQADRICDLVLDTPTQYPPVMRMLLAVLHQALDGPWSEDHWEELFAAGSFPSDAIDKYLAKPEVAGKFDLFNPVTPFMQAAGLRAEKGATRTVALLIPHIASGNNVPLFSADRDAAPPALTPAEAARWLLHAHAWDTAAIKTGAAGDPMVKLGKTTVNPTGPLGRIGVLIPCGPTLWHTLMFNLLSLGEQDLSPAGDAPVWEREALTQLWKPRPAAGLLDLYTWPSRRIRLIPERQDGQVVIRKVVVCAGDRLDHNSMLRLEPHTGFHRSPEQEKKQRVVPVYLPWTHRADRRLWRGLGAILAREQSVAANRASAEAPQHRRAYVLEQLGNDVRGEILRDTVVRLRGFGITYGNKAAVIDDVYTDELPLPVAVLRVQGGPWERAALDAVAAADRTAGCLGGLAADISRASGCADEKLLRGAATEARTRLYARLDIDFPGWISQLPGQSPEEALANWCSGVRGYADEIARDIISGAPPGATAGRQVKQPGQQDDQRVWLTAAIAEIRFRAGLNKALAIGEAASRQEGSAA